MRVNSSNFWPVPAVNLAASASFLEAQKAIRDGLVITAPAKSWSTGRWTLFASARRVQSRAGVFLGTVQAMIELSYFENFYKTISLPEGGSVSVFRRDGLVLFRHPALDDMIGTELSHNSSFYSTRARGGGTYEAVGALDGVRREIAVSPVKDYPLAISVTVPEHTALASSWRRQAAFIGFGSGLAVVMFAILFGSLAFQFSRLERSERALSTALTRTERADRAKSDFLGRMSHELRTPLNAIIGFSETIVAQLFGPVGSPKYKEYYAEDILRSGRFLHDLISDMLDMVKIEAGHRDLQRAHVAVAGAIDEALRMLRPRAETGKVTLALDVLDAPALDQRRSPRLQADRAQSDRQCGEDLRPGGSVTRLRLSSSGNDALMRIV